MRLAKKIIALMLIVALGVTSIHLFRIPTGAEEIGKQLVLSDVFTDVNIVNNGSSAIIEALSGMTTVIDGVTYNNYARYDGVTAFASSDSLGAAGRVMDGNLDSRWESEHGKDPQYLTIDLGNVYSVKNIDIYWEGASARQYNIEVSEDGNHFEKLANVQSNYGRRTDDIKLSKEIGIRAVRIYCVSRTTIYGNSIYEIGIYGTDAQKKVVQVLSGLKILDYYKYTGKYFIYFNEPEESAGYKVYIDDDKEAVKNIKGSGEYLSARDMKGYSTGIHTLSVVNTNIDGAESAKISTELYLNQTVGNYNDIPQVYIYTAENVTNEYHKNANVTVSVIDKDGGEYKDFVDSSCNIKIRGNSTAGAPKKPWNIKLSEKKSILGMNKGKKWCLLANSFDKSLMRNYLAYNFGSENGVTYTCQNRFAEVYLNGVFHGNYLITEAVQAKKERVNIDAYNAESNDILLELGTRNEPDVDHFTTSVLNTTFDVNDPEKGDDLTDIEVDTKIARVREYLNSFEDALVNKNYEEILNYIDEDTFVNFYIVNELFKNVDFNFSSTRFYIKNEKIYAGPLWDFDLSSGNCKKSYYNDYYVDGVSYKGYYCQSMNWYRELLKNEAFYNKVKDRYAKLQYTIQNMYKVDTETQLSISGLLDNYKESFIRNYLPQSQLGAGWELTNEDGYSYSAESGWTSWEQPIEFLRTWIQNRNIWLCEQWNVDMDKAYYDSDPNPEKDLLTEKDIAITGYQMTTSIGGVQGKIGIRTIYQIEQAVNNDKVKEKGLVIGLDSGNISDRDMVIDNDNELVMHAASTQKGKAFVQLGNSDSADYYVMTMDISGGYNQNYKVRPYAILDNGTIIYGETVRFNIFKVAKELYNGSYMPNFSSHNTLYEEVIKKVEPLYGEVEFGWSGTVIPSYIANTL